MRAFVDGVMAAATGAIAGAAFVLGRRTSLICHDRHCCRDPSDPAQDQEDSRTCRNPPDWCRRPCFATIASGFQENFRFTKDNQVMRIHSVLVVSAWLMLPASPVGAALSVAQRGKIDQLTRAKGAYAAEEDVYRVTFPAPT